MDNEQTPSTREELLAALRSLDEKEGKAHVVPTSAAMPVEKDEPLSENGMMKTANVVLSLHKDHTIVKTGVTPAYLQLLVIAYFTLSQGRPIISLTETEPVRRSDAQEIGRLKSMYGAAKTNPLFGINATLPKTFHDAYTKGILWASDNPGGLGEQPMVGRNLTPTEAAAAV